MAFVVNRNQWLSHGDTVVYIATLVYSYMTHELMRESGNVSFSTMHGFQWFTVVTSGSQWLPVVLNGYQWFSMATSGYQWLPVVHNGHLNGSQWFPVVFSGFQLFPSACSW